ncbi:MAG: putative sugar O-methyltransferase [Deltaproteobacteria bacterium]|nr:putative sugar O-methyltransferase [Deltaproteobacteria bacterium]
MTPVFPNEKLLRYLIETYFQDGHGAGEEPHVSSHWKHYGGLFDIDVDSAGNLLAVAGVGIGSLKWPRGWKGIVQRLLDQFCVLLHFTQLPQKRALLRMIRESVRICRSMGLNFTFDAFRQICSLELLERKCRKYLDVGRLHVLMIGDGYGFLSALFKLRFPDSTIFLIDLGKTLLVQSYYCQKAYPYSVHLLADHVEDADQTDFVYCPAEHVEVLHGFVFDIAVNIASMQEMDPRVVDGYFSFIRKRFRKKNLFYCCNREKKEMPGGEVSEFGKYPWQPDDRFLVNDLCPWHQYFLAARRSGNEHAVFGVKVPFVHHYDGPHLHRLAVMATDDRGRNNRESEAHDTRNMRKDTVHFKGGTA